MKETATALIERLFDAFNRRDVQSVLELCDPGIEFWPMFAGSANGNTPYVGHAGMRRYFQDVDESWDEFQVTSVDCSSANGSDLLVLGRVVARSKERGLRDFPVGWVWHLSQGRFSYGQLFNNPREAARSVGLD